MLHVAAHDGFCVEIIQTACYDRKRNSWTELVWRFDV